VVTGIYVRVSTDEQAREGYSIRAQEEKLRSFAAVKNWHVYSLYADEGISGKDIDGRPEMKRLIADISSGKVNNVLVYKIDRLTRSTKNLIELIELFNQHDCAFNSLNEAIDTSTATGRMFLKIVGIFAEFERENLAERLRLGFERKAREGHSLCTYASYGYDRKRGEKMQTIVPEEAEVVRRIFHMFLHDDYTQHHIARVLNAQNISTKKGKTWSNIIIRQTLTNPNYVGKVRYGVNDESRYFEVYGHHEQIVDDETFNQVQDKLQKMQKITHTKRPTSGVYFCGVLYCPVCGGKYSSKWNYKTDENGKKVGANPGYRCTNSVLNRTTTCTNWVQISHARLERAFAQYIENYADFTETNPDTATPKIDHAAEMETIAVELRQVERKIEEIMSLFVANTIDFDTYQGMVKISNQRRVELDARMTQLENNETAKTTRIDKREIVANFKANWQTLNNDKRLKFVQKFVKKIIVHGEKIPGTHRKIVIGDIEFNEF